MQTTKQSDVLTDAGTDPKSTTPSAALAVSATMARYLLGFLMTMGGLNDFLHFAKHPLPIPVLARQYMEALLNSRYMMGVAFIQTVAGILLLVKRFVPLALTLLAAIIYNVLLFHATLDKEGSGAAIVVSLLWVMVFVNYRPHFSQLLCAQPPSGVARRPQADRRSVGGRD